MVFFPPPSPEHNEWDTDEEEEDGLADQTPLEITWVPVGVYSIAVCSLPGNRYGAKRSLVADLCSLKQEGIQDVFVLCTDAELHRSKVHSLVVDYVTRNLTPHHYPISDDQLLSMYQCLQLLDELHTCLRNGKKVAIHCVDGLGRSCLALVLLSMLLDPNLPALSALEHVRQCRGHAAIQTVKQYNFIMDFHKNHSEYKQQHQQQQEPLRPSVN